VAVLLFPVLTLVFMVGWLLSIVGESRSSTKRTPQRKTDVHKKHDELVEEDPVEMGLMDQLTEEQVTT
jgi:hypothetical protein